MQTLLLSVSPEEALNEDFLKLKVSDELNIHQDFHFRIVKRSIDARRKPVKINLQLTIYLKDEVIPESCSPKTYQNVSLGEKVIVVGFGPAGMFAALKLIELGYQPIILERGKDVQNRRRDIAAITKEHIINPDSNYCFGEGGAGTFSDGKLYTRSKKRGDVNEILAIENAEIKSVVIDAYGMDFCIDHLKDHVVIEEGVETIKNEEWETPEISDAKEMPIRLHSFSFEGRTLKIMELHDHSPPHKVYFQFVDRDCKNINDARAFMFKKFKRGVDSPEIVFRVES